MGEETEFSLQQAFTDEVKNWRKWKRLERIFICVTVWLYFLQEWAEWQNAVVSCTVSYAFKLMGVVVVG